MQNSPPIFFSFGRKTFFPIFLKFISYNFFSNFFLKVPLSPNFSLNFFFCSPILLEMFFGLQNFSYIFLKKLFNQKTIKNFYKWKTNNGRNIDRREGSLRLTVN